MQICILINTYIEGERKIEGERVWKGEIEGGMGGGVRACEGEDIVYAYMHKHQ